MGSFPSSRRFPGGGHGNPLQYSCLENPMDREGWRVMVHGIIMFNTSPIDMCPYIKKIRLSNENSETNDVTQQTAVKGL